MPPLGAYAIVAAVAAVGTYVVMFPLRILALRLGFVDEPDERRIHTKVTPNGGGVAMFVAFLVAMIVASQIPQLKGIFQGSSEPLGVVLGGAVIFVVGLTDDIRDVSAPAKMAGEVLAAMVLVFLGVTMLQFKIPLVGFLVLSSGSEWTPLLTALWVIVITNAVNLIDGLDGLATGIVAIASGALAIYGLRLVDQGQLAPDNLGPLIAVIAFGVCVGFLPHNFHPARAFMGDAGALFLGLAHGRRHHGNRGPPARGERSDLLLLRPPVHPPLHPGGAHRRHGLRLHPAHGQGDRLPHPGQGPRPPPAPPPGPRTPTDRGHPLGLDGPAVGIRPLSAVRQQGQRRHPLRGRGPWPRALHPLPPGPA